jgi:ATP-binding cassette, subfamily A (ABC1), member 3
LLTVSQHLTFYARAAGIPARSISLTVGHILDATGLTSLKDRQAATLSGGNKRKLSLAIAVVGCPKVLLLDEMSSGMDAVSKRVVWRALEGVRHMFGGEDGRESGQGMAILITTHSMEEVAALADRVGIMRRKMLAVGTKGDLIRRYGDRWHVHLLLKRSLRQGLRADNLEREREENVKHWIETEVQGARIEREMLHGQVRFWVPRTNNGGGLAQVFSLIEANRERLWIEYYSVVQTNLEDVFLNVVGQQEDE